jgi:hypothetical protein
VPHSDLLAGMRAVVTMTPAQFVADWMFGAAPYAFRGDNGLYESFCAEIADRLAVPADQITLIGSARLGFSLNPDHLLSPFGKRSDLDLVIVSSSVFDLTWQDLIAKAEAIRLAGEAETRRLKKTRQALVDGYLRPDQLPLGTDLSRNWFPRLAGPFTNRIAREHQVKAWLFRALPFAHMYYESHVRRMQNPVRKILTSRGDL